MKVGLLGFQGAFLDHIPHLERLGVGHTTVRDCKGLDQVDSLIIPGGESTVMGKFLKEFGVLSLLKRRIADGMPVWGVCAGAILLADTVDCGVGTVGSLPITISRNAYGRQINSRQHRIEIPLFGCKDFPAIFIRAPKIKSVGSGVNVHAKLGEDPVFIQKGSVMATTFHPELNKDQTFHDYFLSI